MSLKGNISRSCFIMYLKLYVFRYIYIDELKILITGNWSSGKPRNKDIFHETKSIIIVTFIHHSDVQ